MISKKLVKLYFSTSYFLFILFFITMSNFLLPSDAIANQDRKIYYFVDAEIYDELHSEVTQFIEDVSQDTNSQSKLIISEQNQTPSEIRQTLSNAFYNDNLWGAFLIGRVKPAYIQFQGYSELLSDHPYLSFACPYTDKDNNGIFEAASNFTIIPACMPDIWIGRIYPSRQGEEGINQIRSYMNKNHLLRNNNSYFNKKMFYHSSVEIAENGKTYDDLLGTFSNIFAGHPLFSIDDITISYNTGVNEQIDSFLNAFETNYEVMNIFNHGGTNLLDFMECNTRKECFAVDVTGLELAQKSSHVKLIDLDSCNNGHFITPNYFAGEALFSGDTLLVIANPEVTAYFSGALESKIKTSYYGLGLGFSFADLYTFIDPGQPRHFFGDPTLYFRQKKLENAPKLSINGTEITEPIKYLVDFGSVKNVDTKTVTLSFSNHGSSDLKLSGRWITNYVSYNEVSGPSSTNGFIFSITEPIFSDFDYEITIPGGESKEFKFTFYPNANDDKPGTTRYKGVFKFMTNDPDVGSFQIITIGNHLVDTDNDNISDDWEMTYFDNLTRDGNGDYDNDGLNDIKEYKIGTNPSIKDTDSDGLSDGDEDVNRNGSIDSGETDPTKADTDNDGIPDGWEIQYRLDPLRNDANEDADDDGFSNIAEYKRKTNPEDNNSHPKNMPWLPLLLGD